MALATTSLRKRGSDLSDTRVQLRVLNTRDQLAHPIAPFSQTLADHQVDPLTSTGIGVLQVNLGKMCNQACRHCHVDAGPDRKEIMTRETMQECLDALASSEINVVDITGGAPEMNPDFRWFVEQVSALGRTVMVRCNLTIIVANAKYHDLPDFYARHGVHVVSSLPCYTKGNVDGQRGDGAFDDSIRALTMLNAVGYGRPGTGLKLDLVYNPGGASLPGPQSALHEDYTRMLWQDHEIVFNDLICMTNMPIARFLEDLLESGEYAAYMETLVNSFNPSAVTGVMCRDTLSVSWDGQLYDCDFNQMLDLPVSSSGRHIRDFDATALTGRPIVVNQHCYGCTAGAGSSCGGQLT